jgi:hypothetical protein
MQEAYCRAILANVRAHFSADFITALIRTFHQ